MRGLGLPEKRQYVNIIKDQYLLLFYCCQCFYLFHKIRSTPQRNQLCSSTLQAPDIDWFHVHFIESNTLLCIKNPFNYSYIVKMNCFIFIINAAVGNLNLK